MNQILKMKIPNPFKRSKPKKKISSPVKVITDRPVKLLEKEDHQHLWELVAKTYAPPIRNTTNSTASVSERAQFGVTSLLFQCSLCKNFNKEETEEVVGSFLFPHSYLFCEAEDSQPLRDGRCGKGGMQLLRREYGLPKGYAKGRHETCLRVLRQCGV